MIVLCHQAFAGIGSTFEKEFLKHYLIKVDDKAIVANKVWNSWRFTVIKKYGIETAEKLIVHARGKFEPELIQLNENFEELEPIDCTDEERILATRDLLERKWGEIKYFITSEPEKYVDIKHVEPITFNDFYLEMMDRDREFAKAFSEHFAMKKYE